MCREIVVKLFIIKVFGMTEQFYGIKYPFSEESERLTYLDLNESKEESVRSMILHIIFTFPL